MKGSFMSNKIRGSSLMGAIGVYYVIFPVLVGITYTFLFLEVFTYSGFIQKYFIFPVSLFVLLILGVYLLGNVLAFNKQLPPKPLIYKFTEVMNFLFIPSLFLLYFISLRVNLSHYDNYVFSKYHLNVSALGNILKFSIALSLISLFQFRGVLIKLRQRGFNKITLRMLFPLIFVSIELVFIGEAFLTHSILKEYLLIDPVALFVVITVAFLFFHLWIGKAPNIPKKYKNLALVVASFSGVVYIILSILESMNYNNYVFSRFHLDIPSLYDFFFVNVTMFTIIFLVDKLDDLQISKFKERVRAKAMVTILTLIVVICAFYYVLNNATQVLNSISINFSYITTHMNNSYDQKMSYYWGFFYDYSQFVKNNTQRDSIIVIPPMVAPWSDLGNGVLIDYFLYPRKVINGGLYSLPETSFDYIMVARGKSTWGINDSEYGWPKQKIKTDEVIYFDQKENKITTVVGDYDPVTGNNYGGWGLIKIKK